jgi:hypothetical protein
MMPNASTKGITASAGTSFDSTILYSSCRHYLDNYTSFVALIILFCRKSFTTLTVFITLKLFSDQAFAHFRVFPTAASVSQVRSVFHLRRDCTVFITSYRLSPMCAFNTHF